MDLPPITIIIAGTKLIGGKAPLISQKSLHCKLDIESNIRFDILACSTYRLRPDNKSESAGKLWKEYKKYLEMLKAIEDCTKIGSKSDSKKLRLFKKRSKKKY